MDILFPDVYVDPLVSPLKHPVDEPILLSQWLNNNLNATSRVLMLSPAGTGKTTSLIGIQHDLADHFLIHANNLVPLFLEARENDWSGGLSLDQVLRLRLNLGSESDNGTLISIRDNLDFLVLLDALDEAFPSAHREGRHLVSNDLLVDCPHIATSREDFFHRHLEIEEFCGRYDEILELAPWQIDREVRTFLDNYFQRLKGTDYEESMAEILSEFRRSVDEYDLPVSPLSATTFLFLWLYDHDALLQNPITTFASLLDRFLHSWAIRECKAQACAFNDPHHLLRAYGEVAWLLFQEQCVTFGHIAATLETMFDMPAETLVDDRGINSMLRTVDVTDEADLTYVATFSHDVMYEYLLARRLVDALTSNNGSDEILDSVVGHAVNHFARQILSAIEESKRHELLLLLKDKYKAALESHLSVIASLRRFFSKLFQNKRRNLERRYQRILQRHTLCYFMTRIDSEFDGELCAELYSDVIQGPVGDHAMVMGTIGSGVLFTRHLDLETDYLNKVANGGLHDKCNRSYHRVYYGDDNYDSPDTFGRDDYSFGHDDWRRTRIAIVKRLSSHTQRAQTLRGLDLVTFRRFCETRGVPKLTDLERRVIRECVYELGNLSTEKKALLTEEHDRLMGVIEH